MMTRKHYIAIASALRAQLDTLNGTSDVDAYRMLYDIAKVLADIFVADNSRFNRQTFMKAAGFAGLQ